MVVVAVKGDNVVVGIVYSGVNASVQLAWGKYINYGEFSTYSFTLTNS